MCTIPVVKSCRISSRLLEEVKGAYLSATSNSRVSLDQNLMSRKICWYLLEASCDELSSFAKILHFAAWHISPFSFFFLVERRHKIIGVSQV